jgi:uncharacterized membrane protein YhaH (DUF805 family)
MFWYLQALRKYADFSGRARRREYWMFTLVNAVIVIVLGIPYYLDMGAGAQLLFSLTTLVYGLAVFLPSLAVCVRRLHDTNHSGWWYLIGLVPFIGEILLLVWFVTDSDPGENEYGPNPKAEFELKLA